ncbi:hypothetical protein ACFPTO_02000 [Paraburkholderia denitrificans]|uniref:Transposase n=1 Tax=Paraburkholderia denitrificans TaxID=694025 RepID=A0ABW0J3M3_9BURK
MTRTSNARRQIPFPGAARATQEFIARIDVFCGDAVQQVLHEKRC